MPKEKIKKELEPSEKIIVKNESAEKDALSTFSMPEKTSVIKEEIKKESKVKFFFKIFESIKNFFSKIFR